MTQLIKASLIKPIDITVKGQAILIPINSTILVNEEHGYAQYKETCFDIFRDEYRLNN